MTTATARKPAQTEDERDAEIAEIKAQFDDAVLALATDAGWTEMVQTIANFGAKYSMHNQLLILQQAHQQNFDPELVNSRTAWEKLGRTVVEGARPLRVWAPARYTLRGDAAREYAARKRIKWTGQSFPIVKGFTIESVYDLADTEGAEVAKPEPIVRRYYAGTTPLPSPVLLTGDDNTDSLALVVREIEARGWTFELADSSRLGHANGHADPSTKTVRVRRDVDPAQQVKTAVHELAHIALGHTDDMAEYVQHRGRMETEAESVAHIVLKVLGADTGAYSAPYVASWSNASKKVLERAAKAVFAASREILRALEPAQAPKPKARRKAA